MLWIGYHMICITLIKYLLAIEMLELKKGKSRVKG